MFSRTPSRVGLTALVSVGLLLGTLWTSSASAHAAATTPTTGCPTPQILGGMNAVGATIATPGAKARTLDESQATAFMQTWLAYSVFEKPPQQHPPANLPVSTLTVSINQDGTPSQLTIFYATDGTRAWVGAPAPAPVPPPPNNQKWILVPKPAETIAAFNGTMAPICVDPTGATSTVPGATTTRGLAVKPDSTSSDNGTFWILAVVAVLVVAAAAVAASRIRRRRTA